MNLWMRLRAGVLLAFVVAASGCASIYVDGTTKEVPAAQFKKPATARPVQVLFEFQTKGVANARATDLLKARVVEQVKASGLFSTVAETPVDGGALLSITLNNVPLTDDAFTKGFITGFTFGLAGSQVSDGYVCTARYLGGPAAAPVTKQARHAIHASLGVSGAPANAVKADNATAAAQTMTQQVISNVLNDLSQDAQFK